MSDRNTIQEDTISEPFLKRKKSWLSNFIERNKAADAAENKRIQSWSLTKRIVHLATITIIGLIIITIFAAADNGTFSYNFKGNNIFESFGYWITSNWIFCIAIIIFSIFLSTGLWFGCYKRKKTKVNKSNDPRSEVL